MKKRSILIGILMLFSLTLITFATLSMKEKEENVNIEFLSETTLSNGEVVLTHDVMFLSDQDKILDLYSGNSYTREEFISSSIEYGLSCICEVCDCRFSVRHPTGAFECVECPSCGATLGWGVFWQNIGCDCGWCEVFIIE